MFVDGAKRKHALISKNDMLALKQPYSDGGPTVADNDVMGTSAKYRLRRWKTCPLAHSHSSDLRTHQPALQLVPSS